MYRRHIAPVLLSATTFASFKCNATDAVWSALKSSVAASPAVGVCLCASVCAPEAPYSILHVPPAPTNIRTT
jgi:hypothetical protein